jgi:hypothetical protein
MIATDLAGHLREFGGSLASIAVTAMISTPAKAYAAIGIPALAS